MSRRRGTRVRIEIRDNRFREARADIVRAVHKTLDEMADQVVEDARALAPVQTGKLRASIESDRK